MLGRPLYLYPTVQSDIIFAGGENPTVGARLCHGQSLPHHALTAVDSTDRSRSVMDVDGYFFPSALTIVNGLYVLSNIIISERAHGTIKMAE